MVTVWFIFGDRISNRRRASSTGFQIGEKPVRIPGSLGTSVLGGMSVLGQLLRHHQPAPVPVGGLRSYGCSPDTSSVTPVCEGGLLQTKRNETKRNERNETKRVLRPRMPNGAQTHTTTYRNRGCPYNRRYRDLGAVANANDMTLDFSYDSEVSK